MLIKAETLSCLGQTFTFHSLSFSVLEVPAAMNVIMELGKRSKINTNTVAFLKRAGKMTVLRKWEPNKTTSKENLGACQAHLDQLCETAKDD